MPRYVALLRGVSPMNARMPELKRCFESAGFTGVRTVLSSGNVAFDARASTPATLERKAQAAMQSALGRSFDTIVRSSASLQALVESDPFAAFELPAGAKRVVTFLRQPARRRLALPIEEKGARILAMTDAEIFTTYVPQPTGAAFMALLERTFGREITTRSFDTVKKCAAA